MAQAKEILLMKVTVIHHSADFDGLFCREIARKFLPEAELIGWDFGDATLQVPEGQIYVMDLPLDAPFGGKPGCFSMGVIMAVQENRLWWLDHHKSAIETHAPETPGYRLDGVAACRLAWQWFTIVDGNTPRIDTEIGLPIRPAGVLPMIQDFKQRTVSEPLAVRLAGEYDIWDKRDPDAELFQHGLRSRDLERLWPLLLEDSERGRERVFDLLESGRSIQYVRANEYREVITQQGFDIQFEGLTFLACNSHELDIRSHLFVDGIRDHHDALLGFTFAGHDWRVSMYHAPNNEHHDLSQIAVKYGGGGHRGACGFRIDKLPFI